MKVLLLNADFTPYDIIGWQRAFCLMYGDPSPVKKLSEYNHYIRDGRGNRHAVPAVLCLKQYQNRINLPAPYSKTAIFIRDLFRCQYCGRHLRREHCTVDHVVPKHFFRTNKSTVRFSAFENVVTACKRCNSRKGSKTLEQAGMKLLGQPKRVTRAQIFVNKLYLSKIPQEWESYLNVPQTSQARQTTSS
jgi:5-methylcytosine-specific restriction endonuclease McrA